MKLRAVSTDSGKPLTNDWAASAMRNFLLAVPFAAFVELYVMLNNDGQQRLGDPWVKTRVVIDTICSGRIRGRLLFFV